VERINTNINSPIVVKNMQAGARCTIELEAIRVQSYGENVTFSCDCWAACCEPKRRYA